VNRDQAIGAVILIASVAGIAIYGWLVYAFAIVVLQLTAFLAVAAVLVILAWIGWTMATTPPPEPIDFEALGSATAEEKPSAEEEKPQTKGDQ